MHNFIKKMKIENITMEKIKTWNKHKQKKK
jgi:hypothetical protein